MTYSEGVYQAACRKHGSGVSMLQRAYKTELNLNNAKITACRKRVGAARWAYHWGLARKQDEYRGTGASPSATDLHRELNTLKQTDAPWMYVVGRHHA
jgi:hypothetical protein